MHLHNRLRYPFINTPLGRHFASRGRPTLLLLVTLSTMVAVGLLAAQQPLLAVAVVVGAVLSLVIVMRPEDTTLAVVFILYTNAAVVVVQFHHVPFIIGASVPALLIAPLAYYLIVRREKLIFHPVLLLLLIFLLIQMLGTLLAIKFDVAISSITTFATEGVMLYFLLLNVVRTSEVLRRVVWVLLLAGALLGGLSCFQQITQTYDNNYAGFGQVSDAAFRTGEENLQGDIVQPRLAGPIGNQNYYAQFMLMLVPLGVFLSWGERSKRLKILAAVGASLTALGAALTFSRGAAVGFLLMIVIMSFLRYVKLYQVAIIGVGTALLLQAVPQYGTRLTSLDILLKLPSSNSQAPLSQADVSTRSRLTEMGAALFVFLDHPFIGVGPGMFKYYYQDYAELIDLRPQERPRAAHDLYADIAADTGAAGLASFLAILFVTLKNLARIRKRRLHSHPELANMATGFMLSIASFMVTGLFLSFAFERYFWLIIALANSMSYIDDRVSASAEIALNHA